MLRWRYFASRASGCETLPRLQAFLSAMSRGFTKVRALFYRRAAGNREERAIVLGNH
jgi:hypothetical protein